MFGLLTREERQRLKKIALEQEQKERAEAISKMVDNLHTFVASPKLSYCAWIHDPVHMGLRAFEELWEQWIKTPDDRLEFWLAIRATEQRRIRCEKEFAAKMANNSNSSGEYPIP